MAKAAVYDGPVPTLLTGSDTGRSKRAVQIKLLREKKTVGFTARAIAAIASPPTETTIATDFFACTSCIGDPRRAGLQDTETLYCSFYIGRPVVELLPSVRNLRFSWQEKSDERAGKEKNGTSRRSAV